MRILFFISSIFRGTHFLLLGTFSAGLVTYLTGTRWFASIYTQKKIAEVFFIILIVVFGFWRTETIIGVLPIVAGILGTLAAFTSRDRHTRVYLIVAIILWVIHNIVVFTPVGLVSSVFFLISNMIGYERFYHHNHVCLYNCQPVHANPKK